MNVRGRAGSAVAGVALLALAPGAAANGFDPAPAGLTTEHAGSGVQVDATQPRLSWQDARAQTAYEVVLSGGRRVLWDSGKVASSDETDIPYGGPALQSDATYSWSVRV